VTAPQFVGLSKKVVGPLHKHLFRRGINGRSRPRIEIMRHLPKFIDGRHAFSVMQSALVCFEANQERAA
jgi:hypothetical protein